MSQTFLDWNLHNSPVLGDGKWYYDFSKLEKTAASFKTIAQGGFDAGVLTLTEVPEDVIMDALRSNWLMKEIRVTSGRGDSPYQAFVSQVSGKVGKHTYARDMTPMFNRALLGMYEPDPAHSGQKRAIDLPVDKSNSQTKYGIKEGRLDLTQAGTMTRSQATRKAKPWLADVGVPRKFEIKLGSDQKNGPNTLSLAFRGYWWTTQWRWTRFRVRTSKDVQAILYTAGNNKSLMTQINPDGSYMLPFLNRSSVSDIRNTGISLTYNANGSWQTFQDYIVAICKFANANEKRSYARVWEDRIMHLATKGTDATYYTRSDDGRSYARNKTPIPAWMIRAGNFIIVEDYFGDAVDLTDDTLNDSRSSFIDETNYDDLTGVCTTSEAQAEPATKILGRVVNKARYINA